MKRLLTTMGLMALLPCLLAGFALNGYAQEREDLIYARDIGDAEITLDGMLDEEAWAQADSINLVWGERAGLPGSGWRFHEEPTAAAEPDDPINATIKFLRKGDQLYVAAVVPDKSIGGSTGLWKIDGLVMNFVDRVKYMEIAEDPTRDDLFPSDATSEYFVAWWHEADTTDADDTYASGATIGSRQPVPGAGPRLHGKFGSPNNQRDKTRTAEQIAAWDAVTVVEGTTNDDTHGEDVGYTIEMRADLSVIGYDVTKPEGELVPASVTIYDNDWLWPLDADRWVNAKVWFQNQWGNNLNEGAALIVVHPDVTLDTPESALPPVGPDFVIPNAEGMELPTIDGVLDEEVWQHVPFQAQWRYKDPEANASLPGYGQWFTMWFTSQNPLPPVVDPSLGKIKFFFQGTKLYIGVEVEDQAISGRHGEGGDGMSVTISHRDSLDGDNTLEQYRFTFSIDSTGGIVMADKALDFAPEAVQATASLLPTATGTSTPGDPSDIDTGYQFEIVIDLVAALGYSEDLDDHWLWVGAHLFDRDDLLDEAASYSTRTWWLRERTDGPGAFAYLDPEALIVANERPDELPGRIALEGNFPNPFNPVTTLKYSLPAAGDVKVTLYDVLGREVKALAAGVQMAGTNTFEVDASSLSSGVYFYRVQLTAAGKATSSVVGRMVLLK